MDRLIEGFRAFRETYYRENRVLFDALLHAGQAPRAMVLACCDSRVDPQIIFRAEPGELFVARNVGALVPPYAPNADYHGTSAALEFAVRTLLVEHVIVLGHSYCGGVKALLDGAAGAHNDFISTWMSIAEAARERARAAPLAEESERRRCCEREVVKVSLANLMTFPWLAERVGRNALALHGWYYDLEEAMLLRFDPASDRFLAAVEPATR
jgi:carbonic anhydrase